MNAPNADAEAFGSPNNLGRFRTTRWTMVARAIDRPGVDQMAALEDLCRIYRPAVVSYLRRMMSNPSDVEDMTQQFFVHLLTKDTLKKVDAERGRFRRFLLTCLNNYSANEFQRGRALKRGGHLSFSSTEDVELYQDRETPDRAFDRKWAETVLEQALENTRKDWLKNGKPFDQLKEYLVTPRSATAIALKAKELDISEAALKSSIYRLRQAYGSAVRSVIAETLSEHQTLEDELETLLGILGS